MAHNDQIAKKWQTATGYKGGAFKELILNDLLLDKVPGIVGSAILELGVGNGYFMPLLLRRFSGQNYARLVLTDHSVNMLQLAGNQMTIPGAEYQLLDVGAPFPFENESFELIIASFVFNEVSNKRFFKAMDECYRVLTPDGVFLMTVAHPEFVANLDKRGQLKRAKGGLLTMPGGGNLRLPVVPRSKNDYENILAHSGLQFESEDVFPNNKVLNSKPGLRQAGRVPLALIFTCMKKLL